MRRAKLAVLGGERAAAVADGGGNTLRTERDIRRIVRSANMTRLAIQRTAAAMTSHIVTGVGAHGLLRPARFERIVRDLTMYLRQPNSDGTLADVGRSALMEGGSDYWMDPDITATP